MGGTVLERSKRVLLFSESKVVRTFGGGYDLLMRSEMTLATSSTHVGNLTAKWSTINQTEPCQQTSKIREFAWVSQPDRTAAPEYPYFSRPCDNLLVYSFPL